MFEMMLVIQAIVSKFKIETNSDTIEINPLITLKPVGAKMKFSKLHRD